MALLHVPPADAAAAEDRAEPIDEIIDLTDRRRVLLHAVFGVAVDCDTADAVFEPDLAPMSVDDEDGAFSVEDPTPET